MGNARNDYTPAPAWCVPSREISRSAGFAYCTAITSEPTTETIQLHDIREEVSTVPKVMKAAVFVEPGRIELREKPVPQIGPGKALVKVTTTTVCGTDVHILKGEYPVKPGLSSSASAPRRVPS